MIFQYSPNAFYRVVFAMIGRIVGQLDINRLASGELNDPLDELSSAATIFWPVASVDYYRVQIGLIFKCPPQVLYGIYHKIRSDHYDYIYLLNFGGTLRHM